MMEVSDWAFGLCWVAIVAAFGKAAVARWRAGDKAGLRSLALSFALSVPPLLWFSMALFHLDDDLVWKVCRSMSPDSDLIPLVGLPAVYSAIVCLFVSIFRKRD